jgi:excinuclease ABC subunit A
MFPASAGLEEIDAGSNGNPKQKKHSGRQTSKHTRVKAHLMSLLQRGFTRLYKNGQVIELATPDSYTDENFDETFVLVDRLSARPEVRARLVDSLEICYREGHGQAIIESADERHTRMKFSEGFECKPCAIRYAAPEPQLFSFNNPFGACPTCQGFGNTIGLDLGLVIPNRELSLAAGAIEPWTKPQYEWAQKELIKFSKQSGIPTDVPFRALNREQQKTIVQGRNGFDGVMGFFDWLETKKYKLHVRVFLSKYRGYTLCPACGGARLRLEARLVRVGGKTLPEICAMTSAEAASFFQNVKLDEASLGIAGRILHEIRSRLKFLIDVGLQYLTLDRLASTLSGGEAQRIQLATNDDAS